jgi:hypothetical protein
MEGKKMEERNNNLGVRLAALAAFIFMVALNALANILPINGVDTGAVSDSYPNLFAPAGVTFAIWGVIYLLLGVYTIYQLMPKDEDMRELTRKLALPYIVTSLANGAWILAWHYGMIPVSMILMLVILASLIYIGGAIFRRNLTKVQMFLVAVPFSVYFGWISVATIANATVLFVDMGWKGFGIPEAIWTATVMAVGALVASIIMITRRDAAYGFVFIWAYGGILLKHTSEAGFNGQHVLVVLSAAAFIALFTMLEISIGLNRRSGMQKRSNRR